MWTFIKHEIDYWLRSPMLWIFFTIISLLVFGAVSSENVQIGGGVGNVVKNAPSVIQNYYGVMSLICLLMTTAFMHAAANRDFGTGMHQFVFSSPIKQRDYYFGKFIGALIISIIPMLGVSFGALLGPLMPWVQPERYGDIIWNGHLWGILGFAIPNALISGIFVYSLAVSFRSNIVSYVGAMLFLIFNIMARELTSNLDREWMANLLDPSGFAPLSIMSKYVTVQEKNLAATALEGMFLLNRLLWVGLSIVTLALVYRRFSFYTKKEKVRKNSKKETENENAVFHLPQRTFAPNNTTGFSLRSMLNLTWFETKSILKNPTFIIIAVLGLINVSFSLAFFNGSYGSTMYPVTYSVIDRFEGSFFMFVIAIITFYSGVLVWKDRDAKINEIKDSAPTTTGLLFSSKLIALLLSIFTLLALIVFVGIFAQTLHGYFNYEFNVYVVSLLTKHFLSFAYFAVSAILFQYLINNRYIAYFAFIAFVVVNSFLWMVLEVNSNMLAFGGVPSVTYSHMNGYSTFVSGMFWFNVYWILFCAILCLVIYAFFIRGQEISAKMRLRYAGQRLRKSMVPVVVILSLFVACASFVYYNTEILNKRISTTESRERSKEYELKYKQYQGITQPRWVKIDFDINLFPYQRDLFYSANALIVNKSNEEISEFHFTMPYDIKNLQIDIPNITLKEDDKRLKYRIYTLSEPMKPGDTLPVKITGEYVTHGFQNEVSFTSIVENGSFFNSTDLLPVFGYSKRYEVSDKNRRKKLDLPARERMPVLDEENLKARSNTYISQDADWVDVRTVFSTAADQIAIAPGSLVRQWTENERNYFEYHMDHQSLNFYSFLSARYEVAREKWNDIDIEVYYHKEHEYNVPNMVAGLKKSLDYYTTNFGPYFHKQCRIIEFPRYGSFAQAFPGTMPYSEGIGFITDLRNVTEDDIDVVFYVVAHEMAHQYWAHQLIGPEMRGTEMLSESFAQYSALMVMEKEYGHDKMKKFLRYEMNSYLRGRGRELEAERAVYEIEHQGYIHYNKGSVVMYYLKEMIGEAKVNKALENLLKDHAYKEPPYPTSLSGIRAFRAVTPDSLQYLIDDLFLNITLFSNRVMETYYTQVGDEYEVTLKTNSEKFRSDSLGHETPQPLNDYIDVGVFAKTDRTNILGTPLHYQRVKLSQTENTFTFRVKEKPYQVGIDPYNYLIDRHPDDNVKKVSLQ
jgi:ABC-type transport system involved in multi-copper enzyme maturation permease subunit